MSLPEVATSSRVSDELLVALVLEWARDIKPELYEKTLACSQNSKQFRNCLIRLIEVRSAEDRKWRNGLPLEVLDETSLMIQVRVKSTGKVIQLAGKKAKQRKVSFRVLRMGKEVVSSIAEMMEDLDLESID